MSNQAAGFPRPACPSDGPHNLQWFRVTLGQPEAIGLSCHSCEKVWSGDLLEAGSEPVSRPDSLSRANESSWRPAPLPSGGSGRTD